MMHNTFTRAGTAAEHILSRSALPEAGVSKKSMVQEMQKTHGNKRLY